MPDGKRNPYLVVVLTSLSGTNYMLNEHEVLGQCGPYVKPSEKMLCSSHPASLGNLHEIPIEL